MISTGEKAAMSLPTLSTAFPTAAAGDEPDLRGTVHRPALRPADTGPEARFLTAFFDELTGSLGTSNLDAGGRRGQGS